MKKLALAAVLAPLAALTLAQVACRAIVGSYEVGNVADSGPPDGHGPPNDSRPLDDTRPPDDTSTADTPPDGGAPITSCRQLVGKVTVDGVQHLTLKSGAVDVWCDMGRGGYTLVATRAGNTPPNAWKSGTVPKVTRLDNPMSDFDAVLDVDWTELGFDEVVYEIGGPPTRISFPVLSSAEKAGAKAALFTFAVGTTGPHPDCSISGSTIPACSPPPPPPGSPDQSIGWVYDPLYSKTGKECWWGYGTSLGTQSCDTGGVGMGRVWVR